MKQYRFPENKFVTLCFPVVLLALQMVARSTMYTSTFLGFGRSQALMIGLVLVVGAAALTLRREPEAPDRVAAPQVQLRTLTMESTVYAAQADPYFHVDSGCSAAMAEQVQLQLVTAMEFEKEICPNCGRNVQLP